MRLIDTRDWARDKEFSPYPEGSRDKYACISPDSPRDRCILPRHRYLVKFSNPRYPVQFWSEVIAEILGRHMAVKVPACFVTVDPENGQCASLIEWFYGAPLEASEVIDFVEGFTPEAEHDLAIPRETPRTYSRYVAGSNYMVRKIPDFDLKTGRQHNLHDLRVIITALGKGCGKDFWPHWGGILAFDALIGNTDRHQDNWGILWRANSEGKLMPRCAPAFDNGTSLLHEIMESRLNRFANSDHVDRYIGRGYHHLRNRISDERHAPHCDLLAHMIAQESTSLAGIKRALNFDIEVAFLEVAELRNINVSVPLLQERIDAIKHVVAKRQLIFKDQLGL